MNFFQDISLLLVRIVLVITFFFEARFKFKDMKAFSENDGIPLSLAYVVATAELLAAIAMFTGILAQWAGLGIILLMIITTGMQIFIWHKKYWANKNGWEYDFIMLTLASVIAAFGPGALSISI